MAKVAVIGSGSWGCALACVASRAGHEVVIWSRSETQAAEINGKKTNSKYLGELTLEDDLLATTNLSEAVTGRELLLLSIPTQSLSDCLVSIDNLSGDSVLISTCKGIDRKTRQLPNQVVGSLYDSNPVAALSGPSFASDVIIGLPTAVTVASNDIEIADKVARALTTNKFRCYSTDDITGVEIGGALKNVLALAVGVADGMKLGASAKAALIARGFAEISRLAEKMGGKPETLAGLSGIGDITLSCSSVQSRNFAYGQAMGRGDSLNDMKLAEGTFTASAALQIANDLMVEVPIVEAVVAVLERKTSAQEAVDRLLSRPLKREAWHG